MQSHSVPAWNDCVNGHSPARSCRPPNAQWRARTPAQQLTRAGLHFWRISRKIEESPPKKNSAAPKTPPRYPFGSSATSVAMPEAPCAAATAAAAVAAALLWPTDTFPAYRLVSARSCTSERKQPISAFASAALKRRGLFFGHLGKLVEVPVAKPPGQGCVLSVPYARAPVLQRRHFVGSNERTTEGARRILWHGHHNTRMRRPRGSACRVKGARDSVQCKADGCKRNAAHSSFCVSSTKPVPVLACDHA